MKYDGRGGAESKHISFKLSRMKHLFGFTQSRIPRLHYHTDVDLAVDMMPYTINYTVKLRVYGPLLGPFTKIYSPISYIT